MTGNNDELAAAMISADEAAAIARARAQSNGWGLAQPLAVSTRRNWTGRVRHYDIWSNPQLRGTVARFRIDAETGAILTEGYLPR